MTTTKETGDVLENFTAKALRHVLSSDFEVLQKQFRHGREIDVLLEPKRRMLSPVYISCKNEKNKPELDHIWNWATVVDVGAAAKGIVVATAGFTAGAIDFARNPERRIELWHCRPIRHDDLDLTAISYQVQLRTRPNILRTEMSLKRPPGAEGVKGSHLGTEEMSPENRDKWTYHTEAGAVGNLWDDIQRAAMSVPPGFPQEIEMPVSPEKYLFYNGERVSIQRLSLLVQSSEMNLDIGVDLIREFPFVFENVVSNEISRLVPFNLHHP